ncbi:MAG: VWA domain-containing protein [Vicinamibacterales bacterium]
MILALTPAARGASLPEGQFSSAVPQVEVYASVADAEGRPVQGLTRGDFTVLEDDRPQAVTAFAAGEFPASVALAIDRSVSMAGARLTVARTAGRVFVASLRPDDRAMLIGIGSDVELLAPLSANRESVLEALDHLDAWGTTALYDAIVQSIDLLANGHGRRAIVLLSDGNDRYSRASARDVLERIRRSDVLVYPIALADRRSTLFAEMAALSGGRSFQLRDPRHLEATLSTIAEDLRSQYLIGYAPARAWAPGEAEWRSITVRVSRPGARVRARAGYTTP